MDNDCERVHHGYIGIAFAIASLLSGIGAAIIKNQHYRKLAPVIAIASGSIGTILILDDWQDVEKCIIKNSN